MQRAAQLEAAEQRAMGMGKMMVVSHMHTLSYIRSMCFEINGWRPIENDTVEQLDDGMVRYPLSGVQVTTLLFAAAQEAGERKSAARIHHLDRTRAASPV